MKAIVKINSIFKNGSHQMVLIENTSYHPLEISLEEAEENLKKGFRAVKVVRPEIHNNKRFYVYKCFVGSSKFNTQEMTRLIDVIVSWCHELNIPTDIYEKIYLRG